MNARQNAKNNMYHSTLDTLQLNSLVFAGVASLVSGTTTLTDRLLELDTVINRQDKIRTGYAADKRNKRMRMVDLATKVKGAVQSFAEDSDDAVLYDAVDFEEGLMRIQRASSSKSQCQIIHMEAFNVLASLASYGIVAADLSAFKNAIDAFASVMSMPKAMRAELKTATSEIAAIVKVIDTLLKKKMDKGMLIFKSNPATVQFWKDYTNSRRIDNPKTSFTEIRATILNAETNEPMSNVKMIVENGADIFEEISNEKGIADKKQIHPEMTNLTFEIPGFEVVKKTVDVSSGEKELITVKMVPIG